MVKKVISREPKEKRADNILKVKVKKAPTKLELELQVKNLQQTNDALEKVNRKNIELLENFEVKIKNLESQIDYLSCKETMDCKETQTEAGINLKCDECNFEAENDRELGWHMGRHHGWPSDEKAESMNISLLSTDPRNCEICGYEAESMYVLDAHTWELHDDAVECNFCENTFEDESDLLKHKKEEHPNLQQENEGSPLNEGDKSSFLSCQFCVSNFSNLRKLMKHKKIHHEDDVDNCWNYSSGNCEFGGENCWFLHTNRSETKFKCNSCDKTFVNRDKFLHHRKKNHKESIQTCKNLESGKCKYGNDKCWFNHGDPNNISEDEKKMGADVTEKIFQMMEKFTQQMVEMKMTNNLK